jgi:8-oxo-dGTP diphosphatase
LDSANNIRELQKLQKLLTPFSERQDADAAVALLLKPARNDLSALLVKRVENSGDPWSGQMALPGGRRNPQDQNLEQTVIRETFEETGIDLLDSCRFLGVIDLQRSARKPRLKVLPFVILLEHDPAIRLNKKELEAYMWIPLRELPLHKSTVKAGLEEFPAYAVGGHVIWGLTHRILENFLHVTEALEE